MISTSSGPETSCQYAVWGLSHCPTSFRFPFSKRGSMGPWNSCFLSVYGEAGLHGASRCLFQPKKCTAWIALQEKNYL